MMHRDKQSVLKSGIDPDLKRLRRLHAIKSAQEKKYVRALESVERYWEEVATALGE